MLMRLMSPLLPAKAGPAADAFGRRALASAVFDTSAGTSAIGGGTTTGAMSCATGGAAAGGAVTPAGRSETRAARPRMMLTDTTPNAVAAIRGQEDASRARRLG